MGEKGSLQVSFGGGGDGERQTSSGPAAVWPLNDLHSLEMLETQRKRGDGSFVLKKTVGSPKEDVGLVVCLDRAWTLQEGQSYSLRRVLGTVLAARVLTVRTNSLFWKVVWHLPLGLRSAPSVCGKFIY